HATATFTVNVGRGAFIGIQSSGIRSTQLIRDAQSCWTGEWQTRCAGGSAPRFVVGRVLRKEKSAVYRVRVMVCLLAGDGVMGVARWLSLPFPPFPGLELFGITSEPDRAEMIDRVCWDLSHECFHVELTDYESARECLSDLIDYFGPQWELHEPGYEPAGGA